MFPTTKPDYRDYWLIIEELHTRFFETEVFDLLDEETFSIPDIESDEGQASETLGNADQPESRPMPRHERPPSKRSVAANIAMDEMALSSKISENRVRPPPWSIGIDPQFYRDIDKADKKTQGRILVALAELATKRLMARGDTITPLERNYKKYWRYRIGDYRLIFFPDEAQAQITLVAFASRGSIYDD